MSSHIIAVFLYLCLLSQASADTNSTDQTFQEYIDEKQKNISDKVIEWSKDIDEGISSWMEDSDNDGSCEEQEDKLDNLLFYGENGSIDEFFQNEKFIDETEKRFVRVRLGSYLQSKDSTTFNYKIRVQIPLSRTKERFKLFIDSVQEDYFDDTTNDDTDKSTDIGINYFSPEYHGIKSKYSLGTSGFNAYLRARYSKSFKSGKWKIEPTQQFKYSIEDDWQEETNIYFDRAIKEFSLFRTTLHRRTRAHLDGMDYRLSFTYFYTPSKTTGLSLTQSFWGNTKYVCDIEPEPYGDISDYVTTLSWRQSVWRKWFAYEVQPGISFHRQYDYEANYILRLNLDFYFGSL